MRVYYTDNSMGADESGAGVKINEVRHPPSALKGTGHPPQWIQR